MAAREADGWREQQRERVPVGCPGGTTTARATAAADSLLPILQQWTVLFQTHTSPTLPARQTLHSKHPPHTHQPHTATLSSTSPPSPTGGEWDHPPLSGGGHDVQHHHTAKETKPPNPPPVGKAGFEVWVLTKGGLVSVQHCRLYRTVVHVHLFVWEGMLTLGCVRV